MKATRSALLDKQLQPPTENRLQSIFYPLNKTAIPMLPYGVNSGLNIQGKCVTMFTHLSYHASCMY